MTRDGLVAEAAWTLAYIGREWQGCRPYSRFARSLPEVLTAVLNLLAVPTGSGDAVPVPEVTDVDGDR